MVYMLWRECIHPEFYRYICQDENIKYLNGRDVSQPCVLEIVGTFIDQNKDNLRMLQKNLANYKDIIQYVYSHVFPEIYSTTEKRSIDLKSKFHILFKWYCDKLILQQQPLAKQPINTRRNNKKLANSSKSRLKTLTNSAMEKRKSSNDRRKNKKQSNENKKKLPKQRNLK